MNEKIFKTTKELGEELLHYPDDTQLKFVVYEGGELTLRCDDGVTIPYYNSCPDLIVIQLDVIPQWDGPKAKSNIEKPDPPQPVFVNDSSVVDFIKKEWRVIVPVSIFVFTYIHFLLFH